MRKILAAVALVLLWAVVWAGPGKAPAFLKVKQFKPHHGRTLVPLETLVKVKFSRPLDLATVTAQTAGLRKLSGEFVAVTYSTDRTGRQLVLKPVDRLAAGTDFQVLVRPGLRALDGSTLRADRHANFYTLARVSPESIIRPDQFETIATTMIEGRAAHSGTLMADGRVLLAGGLADYATYALSGDVFDPTTKKFSASGGQLQVQRAYHPGIRFGTAVILVGGSGVNGALNSTEVYFPQNHSFVVGPKLNEERDFVAAVALKNGRVLVVGGLSYTAQGAIYSETAEVYDASYGGFRFTKGAPIARRAGHSLTLLPSGKVLVVGGQAGGASTPVLAELFDPDTETFTATTGTPQYHRQLHTATSVDDKGRVLFVDGGSALLEMYDAATDVFYAAGGASSVNRTGATASLLPDGRVLIAGGLEDNGGPSGIALDGFDLWVPSGGDHGSVLRPSIVFPEPRYGHTATTVYDGRVIYAGGFGQSSADSLNTGIVFTPDPAK